MNIYTLIVRRESELAVVASFTNPREAYRFIDKHIKSLDSDELDRIDRGYSKPTGSTLYHYVGLTLEIKLVKSELQRAKR